MTKKNNVRQRAVIHAIPLQLNLPETALERLNRIRRQAREGRIADFKWDYEQLIRKHNLYIAPSECATLAEVGTELNSPTVDHALKEITWIIQ